jgi:hypothetical protein
MAIHCDSAHFLELPEHGLRISDDHMGGRGVFGRLAAADDP